MNSNAMLEGRTALVTGGSKGIGAACAVMLAEQGADVVIGYQVDAEGASATVGQIRAAGRKGAALQADVTDSRAVRAMAAQAAEALSGKIHILVNNAGTLIKRAPLADMEEELWDRVINVNLKSAFLVTQAVLPYMTDGWGRVINISSVAAYNGGGAGAAHYAASKGGMISLTRAMAKEFAPRGITVNAIAPGFIVDTGFHPQFTSPEVQEAAIAGTLVKRAGLSREIGMAVLYLASDLSGFMTGQVLHINGGNGFY